MRRKIAALLSTVVVAGVMAASAQAASAQTGYPPGPCVPGNIVISAGDHAIGTSFSVRLVAVCLWDPGSGVAVTVNGQSVGNKTVAADGSITVSVTVVSATQVSIDDPVLVGAQCGRNSIVGSAPSSSAKGAMETVTANFNILCGTPAATAGAVSGKVAFTGANILRWGGIALVLILGGWLLVGVARRRRSDPTA